MYTFLECVLSGEQDLVVCANMAYEKSLKRFHGWIVRGIFKVRNQKTPFIDMTLLFVLQVAVRAVPYHKDFIVALKKDPSVSDDQLYEDMRTSLTALKSNIDEINRFYTEKGQHSDATA